MSRAGGHLVRAGRYEAAERVLESLDQSTASAEFLSPLAHMQLVGLRLDVHDARGNIGAALQCARVIQEIAESIGGLWSLEGCMWLGHVTAQAGLTDQAESAFLRVLREGTQTSHASRAARWTLALLALRRSDREAAMDYIRDVDAGTPGVSPRIEGAGLACAARIKREFGDPSTALQHAESGERMLRVAAPLHCYGLAELALSELALGIIPEAVEHGRAAAEIVDELGSVCEIEATVHRARVETLLAAGRHGEASAELERFATRLLYRAATLHDESERRAFLENVPDNAWLLQRARVEGVSG